MDASCSAPQLSCYYDSSKNNMCNGNQDLLAKGDDLGCVENPAVPWNDGAWCQLTAPGAVVSPGTCDKAGGVLSNPETWEGTVRVCPIAQAGGGCSDGNVCVPKGESESSKLCIEMAGEEECPSDWGAEPIQGYVDGTDSRSCVPCACDVSAIDCSEGHYIVYDTDSCFAVGTEIEIKQGTCTDVSDLLDGYSGSVKPVAGKPSEGTCSGGEATGKVEPENPHKICCK